MTTNLPTQNYTIFVLEDDRDILDAIRVILESKGYRVTSFTKAEALLAEVKETAPDLFLLDIWVGGSDGRDVAKWLRKYEGTKNVPIIIVSANLSTPQIVKDLKVDDFVLKPFDMDHLLGVVAKRLHKSSKLSAKS